MADKPDRPKVGPADPETRRKLLDAELNKPTKSTGVAPKTEDKPKPKKELKRRFGPNGKTMDEIEDEAVKGDTMQKAIDRGIKDADDSTI